MYVRGCCACCGVGGCACALCGSRGEKMGHHEPCEKRMSGREEGERGEERGLPVALEEAISGRGEGRAPQIGLRFVRRQQLPPDTHANTIHVNTKKMAGPKSAPWVAKDDTGRPIGMLV